MLLVTLLNNHLNIRLIKIAIFGFFLSAFFIWPQGVSHALTVTPRLEVTGDPGTILRTELKINNEERQSRTFYLRSENFNAQDETGNPSFSTRSEGLATWIKAPLSITLGPGEAISLPVEIDIPIDAEPGGHYAAVFFLTEPPGPDEGGSVSVSTKLGTLILLRVNGDFAENANILEFSTTNHQKFFSHLPIQFYYRFQNSGDSHVKPVGDIQINNLLGIIKKILVANPQEGSVLPESTRRFISVWTESVGEKKQSPVMDLPKSDQLGYWDAVNYQARHLVIGRYKANLKLAFGSEGLQSDNAEFVFYVIPWQLLTVVIPALLIILIAMRWLIKRYNRYIITRAQRSIQNQK